MRRLKLFFACLLMAVLSIGQVWADPAPVGTTLFSEDFSGYAADDVPDGTEAKATGRVVYGGAAVAYSVTNGGSTTKIYNQNLATGTAPEILVGKNSGTLVIAGIPSGGAQAITVSYKQNKQKLKVEASGANYSGSNEIKPSAEGTQTFDITVADGAAATFTLIFTCTGSSNVRVDDILVTVKTAGEGGGSDPVAVTGVSLDETAISLAVGETQTLTATVAPNNATVKTVSWSSSDESVATVDGGVVTAVAEGTATITVASTEDATKKATCAVTVTAAPAASNWQVIAPENLATGDVVVLTMLKNSIYYAAPNNGSGAPAATVVAVTNDKLSNTPAETLQWTVTVVAEGQYQFSVGTNYLKCSDTNNGVRVGAVGDDEYNTFDINTTNAKQYLHTTATMTSAANGRYLGIYNTQDWRCYTSVNNNIKEGTLVIFKEFDNRAATGLNFETEQYLIKKNATFSAPELINPNSLPVTYLSSNTDIAEVAANGAITIKADAIGAATITASFAGDENYKDGSASYTIFVAEQAGTDTNPLTEATAKALIDLGCTANAHVAGTVASQHTSYFTVTLSDGFQFYNLKDLGNVAFENAYLVAGDQVIAYGQLLKYNSTYELATGCYLTSYTHPTSKTPIVSDIDNPITVAAAIGYLNDPTTYDLSQDVWVRGVVTNIGQTNGASPIPYIDVKDANAENSFRFYNYTVNSSITEDPQQYDILIATGKLDKHNTTYELNGCEVVDLVRPDVAVTSVELDQDAASIEVNETVTLHAIVNPDNASNKAITWSVQSGSDYASVDAGVVTGNAEGEAVIRAASTADPTKFAECTVTVTAADPTKHVVTFDATQDLAGNDETTLSKSNVTIVSSDLDGINNTSGNPQAYYQTFKGESLTISCSAGNITKVELTCESSHPASGFGEEMASGVWVGDAASVEFTATEKQVRTNTIIVTYKEDNRADAGISYEEESYPATIGVDFTAPELQNQNNVTITYSSSNENLAHVDENSGEVLIGETEGTVTITATFAGNEDYKPATASYDIVISAATPTPVYTMSFDMTRASYDAAADAQVVWNSSVVTITADQNSGTKVTNYLAGNYSTSSPYDLLTHTRLYENNILAFTPKAGVTITKVEWNATANGYAESLAGAETTTEWTNATVEIDGNDSKKVIITPSADGAFSAVLGKSGNNKGARVLSVVVYYQAESEKAKLNASIEIADIEMEVGDEDILLTNIAATSNPNKAAISYEITSGSEYVSIVGEKANTAFHAVAAGTAVITATIPDDLGNYTGATETFNINVAAASKLQANLAYDVTEPIVLIVGNPLTPATLTYANGFDGFDDITYESSNPNVATVTEAGVVELVENAIGTTTITATLSNSTKYYDDEASYTIIVNEAGDDLTGSWVLASSVAAGDKFIVVGSYNNKTMAMGKQNSNNRAAVASSVDEWNVLTPGAGTKVFTLVDAGEGKFAIQASNGKYLSAAGTGTNNYLREAADFEADNAKWTISIENGVANVVASSNNRNVMRYNSTNNSELFSCYQSGAQRDIQIFKLGTPDYGSYQRDVANGNYGTICLPQAGTIEGATLYEIGSFENNMIYVDEVIGGVMEAGKPYIFQATADQLNVTYTSDTQVAASNANGLHGFYNLSNMATDEADKFDITKDAGNYILYQNAYWLVSGRDAYINNFRAYIKIAEIENTPAPEPTPGQAPRRRVAMTVNGEQVVTGIGELNASETPVKMIIDGQLFIIRGEKMYDATGRLVK